MKVQVLTLDEALLEKGRGKDKQPRKKRKGGSDWWHKRYGESDPRGVLSDKEWKEYGKWHAKQMGGRPPNCAEEEFGHGPGQ